MDIDGDGQLNISDPDTDNDGLVNNIDIDPLGMETEIGGHIYLQMLWMYQFLIMVFLYQL